jgi:hypothetical protein
MKLCINIFSSQYGQFYAKLHRRYIYLYTHWSYEQINCREVKSPLDRYVYEIFNVKLVIILSNASASATFKHDISGMV